jgi:hypothetical protein
MITASPPRRRTTCASSTSAGPAAQDEQAARDSFHAGCLTGTPDALKVTQPGYRRHERFCARRHDNVLRGVADAADFHRAGAGQVARAPEQVNATAFQPALLAGVGIARHHEVPPGQRGLGVNLSAFGGLAGAVHRLAGRSSDFDGTQAQ